MTSVPLRLTADDREAAVALWRAAGLVRAWNDPHADFDSALASPSAAILGIRAADQLVATVMAGYDGHRGWLYYLAVAPDRREQGLGRAMVAAAEAWLRERGAPAVRLMVRLDNEGAGGFYAALGYKRADVVVLGRRLDGG